MSNKIDNPLYTPEVLTSEVRERLSEAQNHRCAYCGVRLITNTAKTMAHPDAATFEHIHPLCYGGRHEIDNIVIVCKGCNNEQNDKILRAMSRRETHTRLFEAERHIARLYHLLNEDARGQKYRALSARVKRKGEP